MRVYIFKILRSNSYIKVIGSRSSQGHRSKIPWLCTHFAGDLPSTER